MKIYKDWYTTTARYHEMGNVAWSRSELFCWKSATNERDHCAIPWRWPNCHQSKTCCPIARTWVGIDRNMPLLQIAVKFNWTHRGYELQHNASVPGSTCTSVSRGSLFIFRIDIESILWKRFSRHNQLHTWKHNSLHVFSIATMLCDKLCGREKFFADEKTAVEGVEFPTGQFKEIFLYLLWSWCKRNSMNCTLYTLSNKVIYKVIFWQMLGHILKISRS